MAHPLYHSISSAKTYGGKPSDYWPLHAFFDQSKALIATPQHRMFLHNVWGVSMAGIKFKDIYITHDETPVYTDDLSEQHIREDLGFIPTVQQCLEKAEPLVKNYDWPDKRKLCKRYGIKDLSWPLYMVYLLMESPRAFGWGDDRALNLTHNAWTPFLIESILGMTTEVAPGKHIPTRYVVEKMIIDQLGYIPSAQDAVRGIPVEPWQCVVAERLSKRYAREQLV